MIMFIAVQMGMAIVGMAMQAIFYAACAYLVMKYGYKGYKSEK